MITDGHVIKAMRAYEALPPLSGRHARMRAALESVTKKAKPAGCSGLGGLCSLPAGHNMGRADVPENHSTREETSA